MKNIYRAGISALSFLVVSSVIAFGASAEDAAQVVTKPTAAATASPATAVEKPKAANVVAKTADPAKPAVKKVAAVSPCKGLDEKICGGNKACDWIVPKDANDKTGKVQEPYCRKIAGVALKKPTAAVTPAVAKPAMKAAEVVPAAKKAPVSAPPAPAAAQ